MDERLIELEMKVTFQERTVAALNEALSEQQKLIDSMAARLGRVEDQLRTAPETAGDELPEPPPPHY